MVEKISLGRHYFKVAFLLRESFFLSSVLTNSEVWYGVTKADLEELEILDRSLLNRIFSAPNSTPTTALYLETGCMRIESTIKARRVNYLHYLVKLPEEEMLSRLFNCQWLDEGQLDWRKQVKLDLADFNLPTNLELSGRSQHLAGKHWSKKELKNLS